MKGKLSLGTKGQAMLLGALALVLVLAVVKWRPGADAPAPTVAAGGAPRAAGRPAGDEAPPAAPRGRRTSSSANTKEVTVDELPVLNTKDFDPPRGSAGETGRDLFELRDPTRPPPPTPTPPEVTFKFLGSFGPRDRPIAVIQQGDEVFNARAGDTLFGKFVLRKVGYESIDVGFVGFAESETKRLAIAQ